MAIIVGESTWATVAEADEYLTLKIGTQEWFNLREAATKGLASKETYLATAFQEILSAEGFTVLDSDTSDNLKSAQIELAFYLLENYAAYTADKRDAAHGVTSKKVSKWSESYANGNYSALPPNVVRFLSLYSSGNTLLNLSVD